MTTALVISGGGAKGAFAVGAIEVLRGRGIEFDLIAGTSTGALIASLVAADDLEELVRIYTSVRTRDVIRGNWRRLYYDARYDTAPLERLLRRTMRGRRFERMQLSPVEVYLCSVGLFSGRPGYWTQRTTPINSGIPFVRAWSDFEDYVRAVMASTNQPFLMPPVWIDGEPRVDGGVREIAPVKIVRELGAREIIAIVNSPAEEAFRVFSPRIDRTGLAAIGLMSTEILNDDLVPRPGERVTVIRPDETLIENDLEFNPATMRAAREVGRSRAAEVLR